MKVIWILALWTVASLLIGTLIGRRLKKRVRDDYDPY